MRRSRESFLPPPLRLSLGMKCASGGEVLETRSPGPSEDDDDDRAEEEDEEREEVEEGEGDVFLRRGRNK